MLLLDRGYPSFDFISYLRDNYKGYFLFRCPAERTFPAVEAFVRSDRQEEEISITPSSNELRRLSAQERKEAASIHLRIIRLVSPEGKVSVLLTNLRDKGTFPKEEIIALYFRRWAVDDHYRSEKVVLEIDKFHGKTPNSIRQELFAVAILSVIARTLTIIMPEANDPEGAEFQFKNAVMTLAAEAAVLVPDDPQRAVKIFKEILYTISRVKYHRPKSARPSQPRINKRPPNKWCFGRSEKLKNP